MTMNNTIYCLTAFSGGIEIHKAHTLHPYSPNDIIKLKLCEFSSEIKFQILDALHSVK